jgi:hypothetical protein
MPTVEPIVVPLGLITEPNKLGQYPAGALSQALGVVMRSPGLLTKAPQFASFNANPFITTSPCTPHLLFGVDSGGFWQVSRRNADSHWELTNFDLATKFGNDLNASGYTFDANGKINFTRSRDRYLFNANQGILIVDTTSAGTNAAALPRYAGFPAPAVAFSFITSGNPGALPAGNSAAVCCLVRRKTADGYEIVSPPSSPNAQGSAGLADFVLEAYFGLPSQFAIAVGDVVEWYRTPSVVGSAPVGATFFLSATYTLNSTDVANRFITGIRDSTPDARLGKELYTNPGQTGALSVKTPPPIANCMATFKGYTFYGNRTDIATLNVFVPLGINNNPGMPSTSGYVRKNGIGSRVFTGTFTNTSNVLTAISAADIVGLAVGQQITDAALVTGSATVTAVGASTVTLSQNANTTVTKAAALVDVIILGGSTFPASNGWGTWPFNMTFNSTFSVYASSVDPPAVLFGVGSDVYSPRQFSITHSRSSGGSFTVTASNGQNYVPALPLTTGTALTISNTAVPNGIAWSEQQQPEAVPPVNTAFVGSGTIYGMWPTRDALWIFASDGLWRLSGTGGAAGRGFDWRIDPVDSTLSLAAPHAACVGRDTVYAYTNRGLVAIGGPVTTYGGGTVKDNLSVGRIGDLLPGPPFAAVTSIQMSYDETNDEVWLGVVTAGAMTYYVYNVLTEAWTTSQGGNGGTADVIQCYSRANQAMASIDTGASWLQSASQFNVCTVDYQPIATADPFMLKQWIDATLVASAADAGKNVTPRFNGVAYNARALTSQNQDARTSWAIPRNVPAVANSLAPGFSSNVTTALSIYGFSLRSNPLTNQRKQR